MKKLVLSLSVVASLLAFNCEKEVEVIKEVEVEVPVANQLPGNITGNETLDASIAYKLTGSTIVNAGATLTIPAGTKITAIDGGSSVYIAVMKGGKINVEGTADNPVVMSSESGFPGDWGGLTICGAASTTSGAEENGDITMVGEAVAEVGNFIYGGSNDADNSGSIKYLVVKGAGANINADSQYNGISFYAVGSATVVENIAIIDGDDDGVEFFGGTVNAKNVYLKDNSDDSVDWTEGWSGTLENAYIEHTVEGFSTVFEGDKDNNNPTFKNITAKSTVGGTALQFKKQSGGTITGLNLEGYDTDLDMKDGGNLSNVKINGADAAATLKDGETKKYTLASDVKDEAKVDTSSWSWINASL